MTYTKRKRLHIESQMPLPGDVIAVGQQDSSAIGTLRCSPRSLISIKRYIQKNEEALVLGLDRYLSHAFVMMHRDGLLGWVMLTKLITVKHPCR